MSTTTNYNLEKYDAGNAANLMNQYNAKKTAEGFIIPGGEA